jgi:DNA-directed RNA polymerase specialized sigma24 family protein
MYGDAAHSESDPLTDEQQQLFDRGFRRSEQRLLGVARKIVGRRNAEEIVHSAIAWLTFLVTRRKDRLPMPVDEADFERRLIGFIYMIGKASVCRPETPELKHTFWGENPQHAPGVKRPERMLARDMESIDKLEVPLPGDFEEQREEDRRLFYLREILIFDALHLGVKQIQVLREHCEETPNKEAAAKLGMSLKTYDNTLRRTKDRMRELALDTVLFEDRRFPVVSDWMEVFAEMEQRRLRALFSKNDEAATPAAGREEDTGHSAA